MDTDINRPEPQPTVHHGGKKVKQDGKRTLAYVVVGVVVLALLMTSWYAFARNATADDSKQVNKNEYQAVFLTNGQVYFGKLANPDGKYITISDIFYLQVQQGSSNSGNNLQNASNSADTNAQVSLAKLGSELHGPEDKMYVAHDQVLFWENLTNSGKVAQAINTYRNK